MARSNLHSVLPNRGPARGPETPLREGVAPGENIGLFRFEGALDKLGDVGTKWASFVTHFIRTSSQSFLFCSGSMTCLESGAIGGKDLFSLIPPTRRTRPRRADLAGHGQIGAHEAFS